MDPFPAVLGSMDPATGSPVASKLWIACRRGQRGGRWGSNAARRCISQLYPNFTHHQNNIDSRGCEPTCLKLQCNPTHPPAQGRD